MKGSLREYVVVLKSDEDKLSFMSDRSVISSQGQVARQGRVFKCSMSPDEAAIAQDDPRVESVEVHVNKVIKPLGFPSDQEKMRPVPIEAEENPSVLSGWRGLVKKAEGWLFGNKKEPTLTVQALDLMATIQNLPDGFGVDVVIVDGFADPNNPEFAKNADGGGGGRLNRINWYDFVNSTLGNGTKLAFGDSYPYELVSNPDAPDDNHGSHVMGISCGNTQGWASKANIYNITPYIPQIMWDDNFKDLYLQSVKVWHQSKPANPVCGNKNPTITNHSYGYFYEPKDIRDVVSIKYRGQTITPPRNYSGAQCSASLSSGGVGSITVTNGGSNYTNAPRISFYGGGQATATAESTSMAMSCWMEWSTARSTIDPTPFRRWTCRQTT